jgi:two-component system OmpR family response regulator
MLKGTWEFCAWSGSIEGAARLSYLPLRGFSARFQEAVKHSTSQTESFWRKVSMNQVPEAVVETGAAETRVVVVDDQDAITDLIATALRYEGYRVEVASSGRAALAAVARFRPHILILDIMLPDFDGFEVHRRLSADRVEVPTLFLTARDSTEDKVRGLTVGGDDYVTKPFSLEELIARVRSVLRRSRAGGREQGHLSFADLEMDEDTREVWRAGRPVQLTTTEFNLLRYLLINARRVMSKAQILDHVWQYNFTGDANLVETYISYLRRKVDFVSPTLIHTVRGAGYSLRLPPA